MFENKHFVGMHRRLADYPVYGFLFFVLFVLFAPLRGLAEEEVEVRLPREVYAAEPFYVTFVLQEKVTGHDTPLWGELEQLGGPHVQSSYQMEIVNGSMTQSRTFSYEYILRAAKEGRYTIPSVEFTTSGGTVRSEARTIDVQPSRGGSGGGGGGRGGISGGRPHPGRQPGRSGGSEVSSEDLLLRIDLNKSEVYVGEPLVATLKVYTRLDLVGFEDIRFPDFKGFWVKEMPVPSPITFTTEAYQGREYHVGVLRQYLLIPQKSGALSIDASEADIVYRVAEPSRSIFDSFFGSYRTDVAHVTSGDRVVRVKELPGGRPRSFGGGVGDLSMSSSFDYDSVMTNEALTYRIRVEGSGNLQLLDKPEVSLGPTVEVFPPKVQDDYRISGGTQRGSVTYEYVLIPRAPGQFTIPSVEYSYFDLSEGAYKTLRTDSYAFEVLPDTVSGGGGVVVAPQLSKEDIQYLGKDIRHIDTRVGGVSRRGVRYYGTTGWWVIMVSMALCGAAVWFVLHRRRAQAQDVVGTRSRRAGGVARRRLRQAERYLSDEDSRFTGELLSALWGFFSDKLSIARSDLGVARVRDALSGRGLDVQVVDRAVGVLERAEYAQFAPGSGERKAREELYNEALEVITQLNALL